jgi:hypothetical protein
VPDLPSIDPDAIANLRELNPGDNGEFLREIIAIYLEDTPKRLAEMKDVPGSPGTSRPSPAPPTRSRAARPTSGPRC